jgi:hypothetical protein
MSLKCASGGFFMSGGQDDAAEQILTGCLPSRMRSINEIENAILHLCRRGEMLLTSDERALQVEAVQCLAIVEALSWAIGWDEGKQFAQEYLRQS